jgi:tetratricopeptide (TPR) repeat protein
MTIRSIRIAGHLGLSLALCGVAAAQNDVIHRKDGKDLTNVTITKMEADKIVYTKLGKEAEIMVSRTKGVTWDAPPPELGRGATAESRRDYLNAAKFFGEAATKATREPIKLEASFKAGRAFALAAENDANHANSAVAALEAYLAAAPTGYFVPEAKVRLARSRLVGGDAAGAERDLADLANVAAAGGWPLRWAAHIQFTLGQARHALKKYSEARNAYVSVENAVSAAMGQDNLHNPELTGLRTEAMVAQGETWIDEQNYDQALSYFQNLSASSATGVKAAALAGQGQILFIQGEASKDKAKLRQAQLALAKAAIEPDTNNSTSAKALFFMGQVLTALGDAEKNSLARAKTYYQSVKNNFPNTSWAAKARAALDS